MGRIGRALDALIGLIEASIERVADPERHRYLEEALRNADRVAAEFAAEAADAHDRLERVLREVGCALGVEGESDDALFHAAWAARGEHLALQTLQELGGHFCGCTSCCEHRGLILKEGRDARA